MKPGTISEHDSGRSGGDFFCLRTRRQFPYFFLTLSAISTTSIHLSWFTAQSHHSQIDAFPSLCSICYCFLFFFKDIKFILLFTQRLSYMSIPSMPNPGPARIPLPFSGDYSTTLVDHNQNLPRWSTESACIPCPSNSNTN